MNDLLDKLADFVEARRAYDKSNRKADKRGETSYDPEVAERLEVAREVALEALGKYVAKAVERKGI